MYIAADILCALVIMTVFLSKLPLAAGQPGVVWLPNSRIEQTSRHVSPLRRLDPSAPVDK
jgi:hypothetical protein